MNGKEEILMAKGRGLVSSLFSTNKCDALEKIQQAIEKIPRGPYENIRSATL
jgi:hypothetical protein